MLHLANSFTRKRGYFRLPGHLFDTPARVSFLFTFPTEPALVCSLPFDHSLALCCGLEVTYLNERLPHRLCITRMPGVGHRTTGEFRRRAERGGYGAQSPPSIQPVRVACIAD
jgi:hypothetical protein